MSCHFEGFLPAALCDEKILELLCPIVGANLDEVGKLLEIVLKYSSK
jgi:hypothetical protein